MQGLKFDTCICPSKRMQTNQTYQLWLHGMESELAFCGIAAPHYSVWDWFWVYVVLFLNLTGQTYSTNISNFERQLNSISTRIHFPEMFPSKDWVTMHYMYDWLINENIFCQLLVMSSRSQCVNSKCIDWYYVACIILTWLGKFCSFHNKLVKCRMCCLNNSYRWHGEPGARATSAICIVLTNRR